MHLETNKGPGEIPVRQRLLLEQERTSTQRGQEALDGTSYQSGTLAQNIWISELQFYKGYDRSTGKSRTANFAISQLMTVI